MLKIFRHRKSGFFVWAILILLMVGLAGFGVSTAGNGSGQVVLTVGDTEVQAADYSRALKQEVDAISNQIGRQVPMSEARQYGIDRMVLSRLASDAALDDEASRLGLSVGDTAVHALLVATPAFRGPDGKFDTLTYDAALQRVGLARGTYEDMLRAEATRDMLAGAIQAPVAMPAVAADTLLAYAGERRRFDWIALDAALLPEPVPAPTEEQLAAFHDANTARYTRPETRRITYALLEPATLAATIQIPEDELRQAYDAAGTRFATPERRAIDRIGFGTQAEAQAAMDRIAAGTATFDAIAAERGLTAAETDQGDVAASALSPEAAKAVFGATEPGVVGPVPTPLGPSIYRINAILAATSTPFDQAKAELAQERALAQAKREILDEAKGVDDMLAGGARLEEIVKDSHFTLGKIALDAQTTGPLADDPAFRKAAMEADRDVETDLIELGDGGLVALRVDAVEGPAVIPLAEIRDRVAQDWTAQETTRRLGEFGDSLKTEAAGGLSMADLAARLGRPLEAGGPIARNDLQPELPQGAVAALFAAEPQGVVVARGETGGVALIQVTEVIPLDLKSAQAASVLQNATQQMRQGAAEDVLALTVQAVQAQRGVQVDQALMERILAQFP